MASKVKIAIATGLVAITAATAGLSAAKRGKKVVDVRIESVEPRDLVASVTASGQVRPRNKVDIASDITGKIVSLAVEEGQFVTRGQFLLEIDPQQAEAAVQRAEAALSSSRANEAQTRANFLQAERNYNRNVEIRKVSATLVTDEQMEQLRTAAEVSKAVHEASMHSVDQALASLRDAQTSLSKTKLYAPMDGRITRLNVSEGETAIMGTLNKDAATLLTISDMSVLETRVKVDETVIARIKLGDSAVVRLDAFPDTSFYGRVTRISHSSVRGSAAVSTDQAVDYEVTVQLVNHRPETRPDFTATARIITAQRKQVLAVPIIALAMRENTPIAGGDTAIGFAGVAQAGSPSSDKKEVEGVFVVDSANKVVFRPVKVGIAGEEQVEILSGLQRGDRIVAGSFQAIRDLKDGALVRDARTDASITSKQQESES